MKNRKGFTLVELIAVIVLIGVVALIAIPSVSRYLISSKNSTYDAFEKTMVTAAKNKIVNCIANNENCDLPTGNRSQKFFLNSLIDEGYLDNMKDPDSSSYCDSERSYVTIKGNDSKDYSYVACLQCGAYYTSDNSCVKIEGNADGISCGDVVGGSTRWTNQNRVISIGCVGESSECSQSSFVKTFNSTTKLGSIIIRDKAGSPKTCTDINAYVDKGLPTCRITSSGDYIESVGWYSMSARAMITDQNDGADESGLLTYGMGISANNRDYNKKNYYDVTQSGITTVLGYVKDIAGNEGLCSKEVKVGTHVPKYDLFYGYHIFPTNKPFTISGMTMENNEYVITTSTTPTISFGNMTKYKGIKKVVITLYDTILASTTGKLTLDNIEVTAPMQQGATKIVFLLPNNAPNSFENISIQLGELNNVDYIIQKIELLSTNGSTWTDQDMTIYVEPIDQGMATKEVSFDNGVTWSTKKEKTYTNYDEITVVTRNAILMESAKTSGIVRIDKEIPVAIVNAKKANTDIAVVSNEWINTGLDFSLTYASTGPRQKTLYYCKDTTNTCEPSTEIEKDQLITLYRENTEDYYFRYKVVKEGGSDSGNSSFIAKFDTVKPQCSFDSLSVIDVTKEAGLKLTCTDTKSGVASKTISASDFTLNNSNLSIKSVTQRNVTNGIEVTVVLKANATGTSNITFNANVISDTATNKNDSINKTIEINGIFKVNLDSQSATTDGTPFIYQKYETGWYSNPNASTEIATVTIPKKNGYVFGGYYTGASGSGTEIINSSGTITGANNLFTSISTIYAKWVACGNGNYCSNGVKTACPAGTYGNGNTTESTQAGACTTCEKGYYCTGGTARVGCGNGKYNDLTGQTSVSACKNIAAGCYGTSGTTSCPNACTGRTKYSAAGATSCSTVSTGYYTTGCNSSNNNCTGQSQCVAGNYCTNGVSAACGAGKYSAAGATTCSNITAGCYGTSAPSSCPNSCSGRTKYSATGASVCSTVSTGYYTTGCNSSSNNCTGQSQCTAGTYCSSGVQTACTGRTKYSGAGASSCSTVSNGYYTTGCNSSNNNCTGQSQCPAGTYCSSGVQTACTGRTNYSGAGATSCSTVSNGYYTTGCNSSNNNCTGQSQCPAGTYCSGGVQTACTGRTKYSAAGATSCSTVSTGYYTTGCNSSNNNCTGQSQCTAGNYCVNGVSTKCATYYYSGAGATSCYDNTTPTINDYTSTNVKDTLTNMTICNFGSDTGSGLKQVEYYLSCNTTHKTATISSGCATITPTPCKNAVFYYRIKDDRNWSGWKNVSNFGAYFLLGREYNKLLMYNPAYNDVNNITFHINRLNGNLAGRLTEVGTTAISKSTSVSNEEIVKRMYRGILGREPSSSEVTGHVNNLKNGRTREQVLGDFINSNEAKEKRAAWGY